MRVMGMLALAAIAACSSPQLRNYAPAQRPAGLLVQLRRDTLTRAVELLAVSDTGLLVLDQTHLTFAPYVGIDDLSAKDLPALQQWPERTAPPTEVRDRLRRLSRFPQGVSGDLLAQLLRAYGQDSLVVLGR